MRDTCALSTAATTCPSPKKGAIVVAEQERTRTGELIPECSTCLIGRLFPSVSRLGGLALRHPADFHGSGLANGAILGAGAVLVLLSVRYWCRAYCARGD